MRETRAHTPVNPYKDVEQRIVGKRFEQKMLKNRIHTTYFLTLDNGSEVSGIHHFKDPNGHQDCERGKILAYIEALKAAQEGLARSVHKEERAVPTVKEGIVDRMSDAPESPKDPFEDVTENEEAIRDEIAESKPKNKEKVKKCSTQSKTQL